MSVREGEQGGRFRFVDSLGRLFRTEHETARESQGRSADAFVELGASYEVVMRALEQRVQEQRQAAAKAAPGIARAAGASAQDLEKERKQRAHLAHQAMREDIESMHDRLRTGLSGKDLDEIVRLLDEIESVASAGRSSHSILPRGRYAVLERLRKEAGELAVSRMVALLQREGLAWPDAVQQHPKATPQEIEASRRRRLDEVRENFITYGFARIAERVQGVVSGWGGDYPDRGSALWEESVLKGVAAALWGRLLGDFVELLERNRERLFSRAEKTVGKELSALHAVLEGGGASIAQTTEAIASSLRVIDEVVPEIAWELVRSELPETGSEAPELR